MAILTTTITLTLTHQTGQRQVLNHSQTNSQVEGQPNRFCVAVLCTYALHCVQYLSVDLYVVTFFTSYPCIFPFVLSPSCFASSLISKKSGFNRVVLIPLSQRTFLELENRSTLSCPQDFSAEFNVCEHHCSWCVILYLKLQHIYQYNEQE